MRVKKGIENGCFMLKQHDANIWKCMIICSSGSFQTLPKLPLGFATGWQRYVSKCTIFHFLNNEDVGSNNMGNSRSFFCVARMSHGSHSTLIPQKIANKVVTCWYHNRSDIFFSLPFYMLIRIDPGSNLPGIHLETVSTALTCDWLYFKNTRLVPGTKLNNYIMS